MTLNFRFFFLAGCNKNNCVNGVCLSVNGAPLCQCNSGWSGLNCNQATGLCHNIDIIILKKMPLCELFFVLKAGFCANNSRLCQNGGTCNDVLANGVPSNYTCLCPSGYFGSNCQFAVSSNCMKIKPYLHMMLRKLTKISVIQQKKALQCQQLNCNNGRCIQPTVNGNAYCKCNDGWIGNSCTQKISKNQIRIILQNMVIFCCHASLLKFVIVTIGGSTPASAPTTATTAYVRRFTLARAVNISILVSFFLSEC
jgi:hypothetical protein